MLHCDWEIKVCTNEGAGNIMNVVLCRWDVQCSCLRHNFNIFLHYAQITSIRCYSRMTDFLQGVLITAAGWVGNPPYG
jgi:hypothetical protein